MEFCYEKCRLAIYLHRREVAEKQSALLIIHALNCYCNLLVFLGRARFFLICIGAKRFACGVYIQNAPSIFSKELLFPTEKEKRVIFPVGYAYSSVVLLGTESLEA